MEKKDHDENKKNEGNDDKKDNTIKWDNKKERMNEESEDKKEKGQKAKWWFCNDTENTKNTMENNTKDYSGGKDENDK